MKLASRLRNATHCKNYVTAGSSSGGGGALQVGTLFEAQRAFSAADVAAFVALTGDTNPIHTQPVQPPSLSACLRG